MELLLGTVIGGILTKLGEKAGEKLLDKGLDHSLSAAAPMLGKLYDRLLGRDGASDLLATPERRKRVRSLLRDLDLALELTLDDIGRLYASQRHGIVRTGLAVTDELLQRIEARQGRIGSLLLQARADYPSLVPLLGFFLLAQQSQAELERLLTPDRNGLDESFFFLTYVFRTYSGRMGYVHNSRAHVLQEIAFSREAAADGTVPANVLLAMRACERLTSMLRSAVWYAGAVMDRNPAPDDLPEDVRVVGRFLRADAAFRQAVARGLDYGDTVRVETMLGDGWHALRAADPAGAPLGHHDRLARLGETADAVLRELAAADGRRAGAGKADG